jgi:hypothetical protein
MNSVPGTRISKERRKSFGEEQFFCSHLNNVSKIFFPRSHTSKITNNQRKVIGYQNEEIANNVLNLNDER